MRTAFRSSFGRDLKKIQDRALLAQIKQVIEQVERAADPGAIEGLAKLSGTTGFYRIRIGNYRIGLAIQREEVEFVRVLHRREIYRYFP